MWRCISSHALYYLTKEVILIKTTYYTTGMLIYLYRIKFNLTQCELGREIGVSKKTISKWETDQAVPSMAHLRMLEELFRTSVRAGYRKRIKWDMSQQGAAQGKDKAAVMRRLQAELNFIHSRKNHLENIMADMEEQSV